MATVERELATTEESRDQQLLTHSRQDCFKTCRKRHWYVYENAIRREVDGKALRMGSNYHKGLQLLGEGAFLDTAIEIVRTRYDHCPEGFDQYEWDIECETVVRLLCGYEWRWRDSQLENVHTEMAFDLPLVNPETGKPSSVFRLAGKIDGIVRLADGRLAEKESKLFGDDLSADANLWRRMRIDHQVSMYMLAARRMGYPVETVLYDVTRKPTIKPTAVPILDELGVKIVLDRNGDRVRTDKGKWRQTSDSKWGYELQTRPMTATEWGEKLNEDIAARPEFYYARIEVPRLDQDLEEYEAEIWDIQKTIRESQRMNRHYRTVNAHTCSFCPVFDLCSTGWKEGDSLPDGYHKVDNIHPELS